MQTRPGRSPVSPARQSRRTMPMRVRCSTTTSASTTSSAPCSMARRRPSTTRAGWPTTCSPGAAGAAGPSRVCVIRRKRPWRLHRGRGGGNWLKPRLAVIKRIRRHLAREDLPGPRPGRAPPHRQGPCLTKLPNASSGPVLS